MNRRKFASDIDAGNKSEAEGNSGEEEGDKERKTAPLARHCLTYRGERSVVGVKKHRRVIVVIYSLRSLRGSSLLKDFFRDRQTGGGCAPDPPTLTSLG